MNDLDFVYLPVRATNINLIHVCWRQNFSTFLFLLQIKAEFGNVQGFMQKRYFCELKKENFQEILERSSSQEF